MIFTLKKEGGKVGGVVRLFHRTIIFLILLSKSVWIHSYWFQFRKGDDKGRRNRTEKGVDPGELRVYVQIWTRRGTLTERKYGVRKFVEGGLNPFPLLFFIKCLGG